MTGRRRTGRHVTQTTTIIDTRAEYRVLSGQVRESGLLTRRPWRSLLRISLTLGAFGAAWGGLVYVGDSWRAFVMAALVAVASVQVLFVGHDAGHQQLFASRRANRLVGLFVADFCAGLSFSWWVPKHSAHHAFPNQIDRDPDIGPGAFTPTESPPSPVSLRPAHGRDAIKLLWSVPLVLLEVGMHLSSARALARRRDWPAATEWLLILGHATLYLTVVFVVLSPGRAFGFIAIQQGLFGLYLRLSFAPNHKGMPILDHASTMGFVQRQVITSRNVVGGRFASLALGGLNYQIEHHLFPAMPRARLAAVQPLVRAFCARTGLTYQEDRVFDSYRQAVHSLRASRVTRPITESLVPVTLPPSIPGPVGGADILRGRGAHDPRQGASLAPGGVSEWSKRKVR